MKPRTAPAGRYSVILYPEDEAALDRIVDYLVASDFVGDIRSSGWTAAIRWAVRRAARSLPPVPPPGPPDS